MTACFECNHDIENYHIGGICNFPNCLDRRRLDAFRWFFPTSASKYYIITDKMMNEFEDYFGRGGCQLINLELDNSPPLEGQKKE